MTHNFKTATRNDLPDTSMPDVDIENFYAICLNCGMIAYRHADHGRHYYLSDLNHSSQDVDGSVDQFTCDEFIILSIIT